MKKLITGLCILLGVLSFAQITYGAKAGLTYSKIRLIHSDSGTRTGLYAGGFATIPLSDGGNQFYIQPELLYTMIGEKNGDENVNLDYLMVPVLFKAYFSEQDTEFFGEVGPQLGVMVHKAVPEVDENYDYNSFDLGFTGGVGFSYLRTWEANIRFYYGFLDTAANDPDDYNNVNVYFNGGIAYRF